jgi:hypothetical protein
MMAASGRQKRMKGALGLVCNVVANEGKEQLDANEGG